MISKNPFNVLQKQSIVVEVQEEMHTSEAGVALCHSFRSEQTAVLGFLLSIDKLLSAVQRACLEVAAYPWSPEWLKLCTLICRARGVEPPRLPVFGNQQLDLPILPHKSAVEVHHSAPYHTS